MLKRTFPLLCTFSLYIMIPCTSYADSQDCSITATGLQSYRQHLIKAIETQSSDDIICGIIDDIIRNMNFIIESCPDTYERWHKAIIVAKNVGVVDYSSPEEQRDRFIELRDELQ